jgi:enoyl-CoA hydratase/carnithine racemase
MTDLLISRSDGIVTATINRPEKKNAITYAVFDALGDLFREVGTNQDDRVLVIRGTGGDFSTGLDLSDPARKTSTIPARDRMDRINETGLALHLLQKPTIAVVDGLAVGAGMSLALGCDFIVASSRARFCTVFARRGMSLDVGMSWLLPRIVGMARAKELTLLADMIDADGALAMGLVNRTVSIDDLENEVNALAQRLGRGPTIAYGADLDLLNQSLKRTMKEALDEEAELQIRNGQSADVKEAVAAFIEKREAFFQGR